MNEKEFSEIERYKEHREHIDYSLEGELKRIETEELQNRLATTNPFIADERHMKMLEESTHSIGEILAQVMSSPERERQEREYMFGPDNFTVRKSPKSAKTVRSRKASKLARKARKK